MLQHKKKLALFGCFLTTALLASRPLDVFVILGIVLLAICVYFYGE